MILEVAESRLNPTVSKEEFLEKSAAMQDALEHDTVCNFVFCFVEGSNTLLQVPIVEENS